MEIIPRNVFYAKKGVTQTQECLWVFVVFFFFGGRGKNFDVFLNGKDWPKIYRRFDSYYLNATIIPKLKIVFFILLLIIAEAKIVPYWKWLWPCPQASSKRERRHAALWIQHMFSSPMLGQKCANSNFMEYKFQPHGILTFCFSLPNELHKECTIVMPSNETTVLPEMLKKLSSLSANAVTTISKLSLQQLPDTEKHISSN